MKWKHGQCATQSPHCCQAEECVCVCGQRVGGMWGFAWRQKVAYDEESMRHREGKKGQKLQPCMSPHANTLAYSPDCLNKWKRTCLYLSQTARIVHLTQQSDCFDLQGHRTQLIKVGKYNLQTKTRTQWRNDQMVEAGVSGVCCTFNHETSCFHSFHVFFEDLIWRIWPTTSQLCRMDTHWLVSCKPFSPDLWPLGRCWQS